MVGCFILLEKEQIINCMSNPKNIRVDERFIIELKRKFNSSQERLNNQFPDQNWQTQFSYFINQFIHRELVNYDKNLYQKVYHKTNGGYPGERTISRAFLKEREASIDLISICGWYLFEEEWKIKVKQFDFSKQFVNNNQGNFSAQVSNLSAGENLSVNIKNTIAKIDNLKSGRNININITRE